jgi:putative hydrolase of the HAD superfamily
VPCFLKWSKTFFLGRSGVTIKAVFFDMGGTIETFNFTPELRLNATPGIQQLLIAAGIQLNLSNQALYQLVSSGLSRYHKYSMQTLDELPNTQIWSDFILKGLPYDLEKLDAVSEDLMFYIETQYYIREMRPGVPEVLKDLREMGLKIGLISNVKSKNMVPDSLVKYGIRDYFDPIVLSCEYGRRKPDPSIFHYAARLANTPTSQCCYVGDRVQRDILGARKAGFSCAIQILHDFDHGEDDSGANPDAVVTHMSDILPVIKSAMNEQKAINESSIKALIFDAGDILYHRLERGVKLAEFIKRILVILPPDFDQQDAALVQQAYRGLITQDQYRDAVIKLMGITEPDHKRIAKEILDQEDNDVVFYDGVRETLHELKRRGFLLGIITDTANSVSGKLTWFERGGFGEVWDSIISSREIGVRKPDPQIYFAALNQLNLEASQTVFVGHKLTEIEGAQNVGIKTIAFNYEEGVVSDFYIKDFHDLLDVPLLQQEEQKFA